MKRKFDIKKRIVLSVLTILIVAYGEKTGHNHMLIEKIFKKRCET
jgi:hypothetical protein